MGRDPKAERKKLKNDLIQSIPTGLSVEIGADGKPVVTVASRAKLFDHPIDWTVLDIGLVSTRLKPWIEKKISEFIGEPEPTLVEFICNKVQQHTGAEYVAAPLAGACRLPRRLDARRSGRVDPARDRIPAPFC